MRVRLGFVSNSSSSSFVLDKSKLTPEQLESVLHHAEQAEARYLEAEEPGHSSRLTNGLGWADPWSVKDVPGELSDNLMVVYTWMDNFCMKRWLQIIGAEATIVCEDDNTGEWWDDAED